MKAFRNFLARHHNNYRGWRTTRKIVVIESDDWGSICMPSNSIYQKLLQKNIRLDNCPYATYDSLASEEDLSLLFSVLSDFRDQKGNHPVITANTVMMNPDFKKIEKSGFAEYYNEPFTDTLKNYSAHEKSFDIWKQGMADRLFFPQFHGREHINSKAWLQALQDENSLYRSVFDDEVCWLGPKQNPGNRVSIRATYDTEEAEDLETHKRNIREGLEGFKTLFGYTSESFIAPNFIWHPGLNQTLSENGVYYIQGMKYQKLPLLGNQKRDAIRHFQGEQNNSGQHFLIRDCVFEPSQFPENHDNIGECLKGIKDAFFWKKPAIITAHRLNFIGYIHPENRNRNLKQFRGLLEAIVKTWPDVEFMTSVEAGNLIVDSN